MKIKTLTLFLFLATVSSGCEGFRDALPLSPSAPPAVTSESEGPTAGSITETRKAANEVLDIGSVPVPARIYGVELLSLRGWFAVIYPWEFIPEQTPTRPMPELFTPRRRQTASQIDFQNRLLDKYGSAADVLSFNPSPKSSDYNHWLNTYFTNGSRPFFLLWEHIDSGFFPPVGPKNMNDPNNRRVFMENLDLMFSKVILPFSNRHVTVDGRAVIYMWSSVQMTGDLASLLDEARAKYPVFFIGSGEDPGDVERIKSLDGVMEYSIGGFGSNYTLMMTNYYSHSQFWRSTLDAIDRQTGKKIYFFATFQAAYDDTLVVPPRSNPAIYPKTKPEIEEHARLVWLGMNRWKIYDKPGPFVIFSELPEGASVIPTVSQPEKEGRYVGYGTGRIEIVSKFFGGKR